MELYRLDFKPEDIYKYIKKELTDDEDKKAKFVYYYTVHLNKYLGDTLPKEMDNYLQEQHKLWLELFNEYEDHYILETLIQYTKNVYTDIDKLFLLKILKSIDLALEITKNYVAKAQKLISEETIDLNELYESMYT